MHNNVIIHMQHLVTMVAQHIIEEDIVRVPFGTLIILPVVHYFIFIIMITIISITTVNEIK